MRTRCDANISKAATPMRAIDIRFVRYSGCDNNLHGSEALRNRWGILAVLFAVRATMAFQFQSIAAVAPLLSSEFGVGPCRYRRVDRTIFRTRCDAGLAGRRYRANNSVTRRRCSAPCC